MEGLLAILGKVGFDWQVALANLFNFLIIFFILKKYAFKPIGKLIKERNDKIEKGLTDATEAESALATANIKKKEIIHSARKDADDIVSASLEEKKKIIKDAKDQALIERENMLKQTKLDIEKEKKVSEEAFNKESSEIIVSGLKKIMEGYVSTGHGEDIIKAMVTSRK